MKIAYVTDTGTGKTPQYFEEKGIFCIPLQIAVDNVNYQDIVEISTEQCIENMRNKKVMTTSLPSLGKIEELFEKLKNEGYEHIIAVPICSGLSGTINAMHNAANQVGLPITTIDTYVTAVVEEYLIEMIKESIEKGRSEEVIQKAVNEVIESCHTYIIPDDLQHLKRGGRLTPLAATLAGLLKIKPILLIDKSTNGKIDALEKVRTSKKAFDRIFEIFHTLSPNSNTSITFAHVDDEETAKELMNRAAKEFPEASLQIIPLINTVSVHTGLKCQAFQIFNKAEF